MSGQILENQLSSYLAHLFATSPISDLEDVYILLNELSKTKQLREITQTPFLVYQSKVLPGLPTQPDYQFISEPVDFNLLTQVPRPNHNAVDHLKSH